MHRRGWPTTIFVLAVTALLAGIPPAGAITAKASTTSCGGKRLAKPGGGAWVCTFDDEFSLAKLDGTKWWVPTTAATGFGAGQSCFLASLNNIAVRSGMLNLTVRREAAPLTCTTPSGSFVTPYTSGTVNTLGRFSQTYGRFEIRAKFPASTVAGLQSSLWLWPTTYKYGAWPTNGEIDIAEAFSLYPDRVIPYVHYTPLASDPNVTNNYCLINPAQFHTYVATWTSSSITITFDGRTCIADAWNPAPPLTRPQPFDQPFIVALTQALGVQANAVTAATPLPATTLIDYVRVWS
ncbi:MAG: hypothetical protein QOI15_1489 [Pseudonocardiales bacterium]|nr:hypothetical protein [Pseudonocardiales bacterium]